MKELSPVAQKFILHWANGNALGHQSHRRPNPCSSVPFPPSAAEKIAATLGIARSNVSNSLHELQNWGIVRVVHVLGDRRDHFDSMKDVFAMFRGISKAKEREIDPTLQVLHECIAAADKPELADVTAGNG